MKVPRCNDCRRRADVDRHIPIDEYTSADRGRRLLCLGCLAYRRRRGELWWRVR